MNIEHIKYVLEVDRAGSISLAADNLFMGQPNLSKAIKELEQTLNITIFKRTSKGVQITQKGKEFLRYAKGILKQYEEIEALGQNNDRDVQGLCVSVPRASYVADAFTTFLSGLNADKPILTDFQETNALRAIQHVSDGVSNLGIIRCKAEYQNYFISLLTESGLLWRKLLEFEYQLLVSENHPLSGKYIVNERDLLPYIEIVHGDTAMPRMSGSMPETERGVTPGDKKVHVYERGSQFDILARVPGAYMWVSPMPQDILVRNGLKQIRGAQSPKFVDMLIYQAGYAFSELENKFISLVSELANDIAAKEGCG